MGRLPHGDGFPGRGSGAQGSPVRRPDPAGCPELPVSGIRFPPVFIRALGLIKWSAAGVNAELGLLDPGLAAAIQKACEEVIEGRHHGQFPIDVFQTGSGTSTNMNANEVIATRAAEILGREEGPTGVHPNDHVNMCQSSNDVIPAAIHVSATIQVEEVLLPSLRHLHDTLTKRATELARVVKTGRTHLMDAMPVRLGQEIGGWAFQVSQGIDRIRECLPRLAALAIGGTAVGTGVNAHPEFGKRVAARLAGRTGHSFVEAPDHFAAQASMDTAVELSGHLRTLATALMKIANDLRWMNSGPIAGLARSRCRPPARFQHHARQNQSVICEAMMMVCGQVMANDLAVAIGNERGNFQAQRDAAPDRPQSSFSP